MDPGNIITYLLPPHKLLWIIPMNPPCEMAYKIWIDNVSCWNIALIWLANTLDNLANNWLHVKKIEKRFVFLDMWQAVLGQKGSLSNIASTRIANDIVSLPISDTKQSNIDIWLKWHLGTEMQLVNDDQ